MTTTAERIIADCAQCGAKVILPITWASGDPLLQIRHRPTCPLVDPTQPFREVPA